MVLPFRKLYWFFIRPKTLGVKGLIEHDAEFLMIRNTYGKMHWTFPGGGVKHSETPLDAVRREIQEEVGIILGEVNALGSYFNIKEHKRDTVYCFYSRVTSGEVEIDPTEVAEAAWFSPDNFPAIISPAVPKVLSLYREKATAMPHN